MRELTVLPLIVLSMLANLLPAHQLNLASFLLMTRAPWLELVNDRIVKNPNVATMETCGSWLACSSIRVDTAMWCESEVESGLYLVNLTLQLDGTIHYYNGPFQERARAFDPSVVNGRTAVSHEYRRHIVPAVDAVGPMLVRIREARFTGRQQCQNAGRASANEIRATFRGVLAATQEQEEQTAAVLGSERTAGEE